MTDATDQRSMPAVANHDSTEADRRENDGLNHAWNWFSLHATHRMQAVNFFLISMSFLAAAYVAALTHGERIMAAFVCILGCGTTLCFHEFERRIGVLLKAAEKAMCPLEGRLAAAISVPALRIVESVENPEQAIAYSATIRLMHAGALVAFVAAGAYAGWRS